MSVNIKVTEGLNIEWGQIDPKVTGGFKGTFFSVHSERGKVSACHRSAALCHGRPRRCFSTTQSAFLSAVGAGHVMETGKSVHTLQAALVVEHLVIAMTEAEHQRRCFFLLLIKQSLRCCWAQEGHGLDRILFPKRHYICELPSLLCCRAEMMSTSAKIIYCR